RGIVGPGSKPLLWLTPRISKSMRRMESIQSDYPLKLASLLADRLRQARQELVRRWLERIEARVTLTAKEVFPTESLLNHVPLLIDGIATYLENPETDLDAHNPLSAKAMA